jgi:hypothetical protein
MTENPKESQQNPPESQGIPPTAETAAEPDAEIEITVDHVYLPLDAASTPPAIAASSARKRSAFANRLDAWGVTQPTRPSRHC